MKKNIIKKELLAEIEEGIRKQDCYGIAGRIRVTGNQIEFPINGDLCVAQKSFRCFRKNYLNELEKKYDKFLYWCWRKKGNNWYGHIEVWKIS